MQLIEELKIAKDYLNSLKIHFSDFWVESLLEWIREQSGANITADEIKRKVLEQWLLLDLQDTEVGILPPNLSSHYKHVLNGIFYLQVMYIEDISRPKLVQLQKIRKDHSLTSSDESSNNNVNRVLQLKLTDGVQEVIAIEYEKIPTLNLNMAPGIKICINGPVTVRKGIFLLEKRNVKVIGGEVEELLVCNAAENIICRSLNKPENPKPINVTDLNNLANITETVSNQIQSNALNVIPNKCTVRNSLDQNSVRSNNIQTQSISKNMHQQQNGIKNNGNGSYINQESNVSNAHKANKDLVDLPSDWDEDEDFAMDSDVEILLDSSITMITTSKERKTPEQEHKHPSKNQSAMSPEDLFDDDFEYNDMNLTMIENDAVLKEAEKSTKKFGKPTSNLSERKGTAAKRQLKLDSFATVSKKLDCKIPVVRALNQTASTSFKDVPLRLIDDDFFDEDDLDMHLLEIEEQMEKEKCKNETSVISINKLIKGKSLPAHKGVYKIKAKFKEVEKIAVSENRGILCKFFVSDGTGDLIVKLENDFIEQLVCVSKSRLLDLKKKIAEKDISAEDEFFIFLFSLKEKLEAIDNVLLLEMKDDIFSVLDIL